MAIRILDSFGSPVTWADWNAGKRDATAYEVTRDGAFEVKAVDLGHGQLEASAVRSNVAEELEWPARRIADHLEMVACDRAERADEFAAAAIARAARRAKKRIRQLCKANQADTLLTLTYRAKEVDLARVKLDLKEFHRRMCRHIPSFGFVAAFETQDRGAWHVHAAIKSIPPVFTVRTRSGAVLVRSYDLLRSVWRGITRERGGNVDVSSAKSRRMARGKLRNVGPARIAAYIAKYATKAFAEGEKWSNRWTKYGFSEVPEQICLGTVADAREAVVMVYGLTLDDQAIVTSLLSRWGEWFYLAAESGGSSRGCLSNSRERANFT